MAFDSDVLPDENFTLKWDGKKETRTEAGRPNPKSKG